jgi:hypothetical protein
MRRSAWRESFDPTGWVVGQIARIKGCRAIGIAGGAEKCRWLTDEAGFDAAKLKNNVDMQRGLENAAAARRRSQRRQAAPARRGVNRVRRVVGHRATSVSTPMRDGFT